MTQTVLIVGAGASYGSTVRPRPPLMRNFVRVGRQRVKRPDYDRLWEFLPTLGYRMSEVAVGLPNLEQLFSELYSLAGPLPHLSPTGPYDHILAYRERFGPAFRWFPPDVFLESFITEVLAASNRAALRHPCPRLTKLVAQQLCEGDVVISFNYDLLIEASLARRKLWTINSGYGFRPWNTQDLEGLPKSQITVLKPHGSLSWWRAPGIPNAKGDTSTICVSPLNKLKSKGFGGLFMAPQSDLLDLQHRMIFRPDAGEPEGNPHRPEQQTFIIPPATDKTAWASKPELLEVWAKIERALSECKRIVCVGYSFPAGDQSFLSRFRMATSRNVFLRCANSGITVVDPSPSIAQRLRTLVPGVQVRHEARSLASFVR